MIYTIFGSPPFSCLFATTIKSGHKKTTITVAVMNAMFGGMDGARTRDPLRDRQVF